MSSASNFYDLDLNKDAARSRAKTKLVKQLNALEIYKINEPVDLKNS